VLCERLVERTKDCCGKSSTEVGLFDTQHILGIVYLDSGQVEEAVEQLEHVVQMRESLAEGDPDRLASQQGLARAYMYHRNEQIAQATELLEHVVKVREGERASGGSSQSAVISARASEGILTCRQWAKCKGNRAARASGTGSG